MLQFPTAYYSKALILYGLGTGDLSNAAIASSYVSVSLNGCYFYDIR